VVVVDGGSTDQTVPIARSFHCQVLEGEFRRSTARRVGTAAADSEYLFFLDSDQVVDPELFKDCLERAARSGADALTIPERDECNGFWADSRAIDRILASDPALSYPRFIRRDAYFRAGGHISGLEDFMEDRHLKLRLIRAGAIIGDSSLGLSNLVGKVDPLALGRRGLKTAVDSEFYYNTQSGDEETIMSVVAPRLHAVATNGRALRAHLKGVIFLPVYWLMLYGPRLLSVGVGSIRSRRL